MVDLPVPGIGPGEILVKMGACGLCGTDLEKLGGLYTAAMPVIGHEAVGTVEAIGDGVQGYIIGDRVFPHHHVSCGACKFCLSGSETMCEDYKRTNLDPGGFSEFIRVPAFNVARGGVLRIPQSVGFEEASLVEPLACCVRALKRCKPGMGDSVLVVGAGPVGMLHATLLKQAGARVFVSDVSPARLAFAEGTGGLDTIDGREADVPLVAKAATGGLGADLAIVAAGNPSAIEQAVRSVRRGGKVCLFGIPHEGTLLPVPVSEVYNREVSLVPSYGASDSDAAEAIRHVSGAPESYRRLVTHRVRLDEFGDAVSLAKRGDGMKIVIVP